VSWIDKLAEGERPKKVVPYGSLFRYVFPDPTT